MSLHPKYEIKKDPFDSYLHKYITHRSCSGIELVFHFCRPTIITTDFKRGWKNFIVHGNSWIFNDKNNYFVYTSTNKSCQLRVISWRKISKPRYLLFAFNTLFIIQINKMAAYSLKDLPRNMKMVISSFYSLFDEQGNHVIVCFVKKINP